ncbi:MAG: DUF2341 domain-containing protein [Candidatus Levybacteria bacterium]|nr:DUF2341 domain-containing protein [Candidatus Levybacteria bacterium]
MKKINLNFKFGFILSILGRVLIPTRNLSNKNKKFFLLISLLIIFVFVPVIGFTLTHLRGAEAAWFDSNWSFRKSIGISAHTSAETNVYINLTGGNALDTSDTSRFQADCGDLRFTDARGNNLPYYIVSGCGSSTTVVHVFFESFPAGAQTIYYYYGNPSAANGFNSSDFSTEASSYTIGSLGSEEAGAAPIAHWKFDDGSGTTVVDSSSNKTIGTLNSFDSNPSTRSGWMKDDQCIAGKCLLFNGSSSYVSTADRDAYSPSVNSISVSFWAKIPTNATATGNGSCGAAGAYMVAKGNTSNWEWGFENDNNTLLCLDLFQTGGNAHKLISVSRTMNDGQWHHYAATIEPGTLVTLYVDGVLVTSSNSGFSGSMGNGTQPVEIGRRGDGNYAGEYVDDVKIYAYKRSAAQVKADYDSRGGTAANVFGASDANKNLTNALIAHWKMDETAWVNDCTTNNVADSSGNGNNGTPCPITTGPTGGASGKFGNAGSFDGSNDYISMGTSSNLALVNTSYTMSAWINLTDTSATYPIFTRYNNSGFGAGYIMGITGTGNGTVGRLITQYATGPVSTQSIASTTTVPTGTWAHVAVSFDKTSNTITTYINGVPAGSGTVTGSLSDSGQTFMIGGAPGCCFYGSQVFKGKIDEARVYTRALSPREIEQLYSYTPGPVLYLNFEEGAGTTVKDRSANNNTGTWNGTAPYWNTGKYGKGGVCDGSSTYVNTSSGVYTLSGGSVELWFMHRGVGTGSSIITGSYGGAGNQRAPSLYIGANNVLFWEFASLTTRSTGVTIEPNKWYHAALTYDSNFNTIVYVNGIRVDSATATTPGSFYSQVFFCRYGNFGSNYFNGRIDEAKIYNYPISPGQIISDMNGNHPAPGSPVGSAIGQWKFDEGYGTTANNSGNAGGNIPGTLTNMASPATAVSGWSQSGKYNRAIRFDGLNDFVSIANNPTHLRITTDLSISAWINLSNTSSEHDIVSKKGAAGQYGYRLNTTSSGNVQFEISSNGSTVRAATSSATLATNKWYHVVGVYNPGNSITVYVDGRQSGQVTTAMPASIHSSTANVNIGAENNGASNLFAGAIDEPKIYSGTLTPEQVKVDFNRGSSQVMGAMSDTSGLAGGSVGSSSASAEYCIPGDTAACGSPIARWDFEEKQGSIVNDKSGNNHTAAFNGDVSWSRGKVGSSANFTSGSNITVADTISGIKTVQFWIYYDNAAGSKDFFQLDGVGASSSFIYSQTGASIDLTNGFTNPKVYVDGVLTSTLKPARTWQMITVTADSMNAGDDIKIGYASEGPFDGKVDQVRLYDYVRTPAQVAYDYNRGAPVGWWKFDECQGSTTYDSSGLGRNGTITIGATAPQSAIGTCTTPTDGTGAWYNGRSGKFNSSMNFGGANNDDYVTVSGLMDTPSELTVSAWVKMTGGPDTDGSEVVSIGNYVVFRADQTFGTPGVVGIYYGSGSTYRTTSSGVNIVGTGWRHLAYTVSPGSQKVYIDGVLRGSTTYANTILWSGLGTNTFFGKHGNGDTRVDFTGQIDDVRVYNYPLTKQQIQQVMNQGSAVRFGPATGAP